MSSFSSFALTASVEMTFLNPSNNENHNHQTLHVASDPLQSYQLR